VFSVLKIAVIIIISSLCACTQVPTKEVVTESIKKIMPPNFSVISVTPLKEVPGLIEVAVKMDKQAVVLYMDKKAQYVISGSLLQIETKKNLTIEAQGKIK
jgi:hypothetical protein